MICSICNTSDLPLSETPGYEAMCIACEINDFEEKRTIRETLELKEFKLRTGRELDINEFFYQCTMGTITKRELKGLPELIGKFDQAMEYNRDCYPQLLIRLL